MMTNKEALFCLRQTNCGECSKFYECRAECNCSKIDIANQLATEALEKQIPKRLVGAEIARQDKQLVSSGNCPSCNTYLCQWKHQRDYLTVSNFCDHCGQRIDFGWDE